jgi:hypothetical protein
MGAFVAWTAASWEVPAHLAFSWISNTVFVKKILSISLGDAAAHGVWVPFKLRRRCAAVAVARRRARARLQGRVAGRVGAASGVWLHAERRTAGEAVNVVRRTGMAAGVRSMAAEAEVRAVGAVRPSIGLGDGGMSPSPSENCESLACVSKEGLVT